MKINSLQAADFALDVFNAQIYRTCNLGGFWICRIDNRIFMFNQNSTWGDFIGIDTHA